LQKFLSGPIGIDLEIGIIAHNAGVQKLLDKKQISWGVQFELARGITTGSWDWDEVESKINKLTGSNANSAYRVRHVMLGNPLTSSQSSVWYVYSTSCLASTSI
jgi:hypothetical protein